MERVRLTRARWIIVWLQALWAANKETTRLAVKCWREYHEAMSLAAPDSMHPKIEWPKRRPEKSP
jgi:hypothetical protein